MYDHKNGLCLRKLDRSDLYDLLKLKQESWWGTHQTPIVNSDDQNRWFDSIPKTTLCMICQEDRANLGIIIFSDIDHINRSLSVSASIYEQKRNASVNSRFFRCGIDFAFEILNMRRINAEVLESNLPAQDLEINHLGFKVEGVRREAVYKAGRYYNSLVLGLLRSEWGGPGCNTNFDHCLAAELVNKSRKMRGV